MSQWNLGVDVLPIGNGTQKLGDAAHQFVINGNTYGVAALDENGKVRTDQLPGFVDDVIECSTWSELPLTGNSGVIYVTLDTNLAYRWGGSSYVEISPSLALGETSSTAFRGDYGNTAYSHATDSARVSTAKAQGLYKIGITEQGHIASAESVGITDHTTATAPDSTDTNLITGRTLYNAIASTAEIEAMFA